MPVRPDKKAANGLPFASNSDATCLRFPFAVEDEGKPSTYSSASGDPATWPSLGAAQEELTQILSTQVSRCTLGALVSSPGSSGCSSPVTGADVLMERSCAIALSTSPFEIVRVLQGRCLARKHVYLWVRKARACAGVLLAQPKCCGFSAVWPWVPVHSAR